MSLKYTTAEAIQRRLEGRLRIDGMAEAFGDTVVASPLVVQIGEQIEAEIDDILRRKWKFPLVNVHPQLALIVESGTVCQLQSQHYLSQGPQQGGNTPYMCQLYKQKLKELADVMLQGEMLLSPSSQTTTGRDFSGQAIATRRVTQEVQDVKW